MVMLLVCRPCVFIHRYTNVCEKDYDDFSFTGVLVAVFFFLTNTIFINFHLWNMLMLSFLCVY